MNHSSITHHHDDAIVDEPDDADDWDDDTVSPHATLPAGERREATLIAVGAVIVAGGIVNALLTSPIGQSLWSTFGNSMRVAWIATIALLLWSAALAWSGRVHGYGVAAGATAANIGTVAPIPRDFDSGWLHRTIAIVAVCAGLAVVAFALRHVGPRRAWDARATTAAVILGMLVAVQFAIANGRYSIVPVLVMAAGIGLGDRVGWSAAAAAAAVGTISNAGVVFADERIRREVLDGWQSVAIALLAMFTVCAVFIAAESAMHRTSTAVDD